MQTLTADEFKKQYGQVAYDALGQDQKKVDLFAEIKNAFQGGIDRIGQGIQEAKPVGGEGVGGLVTGVGKILGGATQAATSFMAPVLNRTVAPAIQAVGDQVSNIPAVQKFAMSPAGEATSKVAETVGDYANAAGLIAGGAAGAKGAAALPSKVGSAIDAIPKPDIGGAVSNLASGIRDVVPTRQNYIDSSLARALDLTQGDLRNIAASTKNEVGTWMADNNLIGTNKTNTQALIQSFFSKNYEAVRSEIGKVETQYKPVQVPRFTDALKAIQLRVKDVVGLEEQAARIENMLNKKSLTLEDVQAAKELIDDYSSLYNKQGDVLQGIEKQGLATVRDGLKTFIETEVKKNTGADIQQMNNSVATAKTLGDAIKARSQRGLTRAHITNRDIMTGLGLTYFGSPLIGAAYVVLSKIWQSPSVRLRVARYLDKLNDVQKLKISEQLRDGKAPPELVKATETISSDGH